MILDLIFLTLNFKHKILKILQTLDSTLHKVSVLSENNTVFYEGQAKSTFAIVRKSFVAFLSTFNFRKTFNKTISFNFCF